MRNASPAAAPPPPSRVRRTLCRAALVPPACGARAAAAARHRAPLRIGMSASGSGSFAALGRMHANGCRVRARTVNGRGGLLGSPVSLVGRDDGSVWPVELRTSTPRFPR